MATQGADGTSEQTLVAFARAARAAGLPVTADRTRLFVTAASAAGVTNRHHVYWAGRATMTGESDHIALYDRVFEAWFDGEAPRLTGQRREVAPPRLPPMSDDNGGGNGEDGDTTEIVRATASDAEVLRHKDIADLSPSEKDMLRRLFATIHPQPPLRRALRKQPHHRGDLDVRRTMREEMRRGGEPGHLHYRRATAKPRRVVLLIDVSGSMSAYADALLRLAHVWVRSQPRHTEVFTIGTRLTRITRALRQRDAEVALKAAGEEVPDWSGGTRLGDMVAAFTTRWGRRGLARGAVIVVFSDGWERGDPAMLGEQMALLRRLAHRVIWVNPHRGKAGYLPIQGGIAAALPHLDALVAGHSLATFTDLVEVVARA